MMEVRGFAEPAASSVIKAKGLKRACLSVTRQGGRVVRPGNVMPYESWFGVRSRTAPCSAPR